MEGREHDAPSTPATTPWRGAFADRDEAGRELAARLVHLRAVSPVVLGLARSGLPVAAAVARELGAPLDVLVVRKLGLPDRPASGMGAVGPGGVRILLRDVVDASDVTAESIAAAERRERAELRRQESRYRSAVEPVEVNDRVCIVVDDAIVTGGSMRAAAQVLSSLGARRVVLAAPVAVRRSVEALEADAREVVVVTQPTDLRTVSSWYRHFPEVSDDAVVDVLRGAGHGQDELVAR